jgi:hypothetical protein
METSLGLQVADVLMGDVVEVTYGEIPVVRIENCGAAVIQTFSLMDRS